MRTLLLCLFLIGCGGDNFDKYQKLGKLRILALVADTPEINAAGTVTVTPLMSFPDGGNTTLDISWEACPDPGIDFGAGINCDLSVAPLKISNTTTFNTSGLSGSYYTGDITGIGVAIPAAAITLLSTLDANTQFNGYDYLFIMNISDPTSGQTIKSFRRIRISSKAGGDLNTNPTIGGTIQQNGVNVTAYPTTKGDFLLDGVSSPQSYQLLSYTGTQTLSEVMKIAWFSNNGSLQFARTDVDEKNEFDPGSSTTGVLVAVYRDDRGGVAYELLSY
jgi:hypothetical protein